MRRVWPRHNVFVDFHRYVALGDSFSEGVGDPDPARPNGVRGWADRVAEVLAARTDDFGYANLAIRGRKMDQILAEQLEPALSLKPDLVTVYAGANDIMRPSVDIDALVERYAAAVARLAGSGAHVVLWTAFDPGGYARTTVVRLNIDRSRRRHRELVTGEPPDRAAPWSRSPSSTPG